MTIGITAISPPRVVSLVARLRQMLIAVLRPRDLVQILQEAGIPVLDGDAVRRYQEDLVEATKAEGKASPRWLRWTLKYFLASGRGRGMPESARKTVERAKQTLPSGRIFVESFDRDPFVRVEWRRCLLGHRQVAYIACWDTDGFDPGR